MKNTYWLVELDISKKQEYIFSSNKLTEIIGASKIIEFVSERLGKVILKVMENEFANTKYDKYFTFDNYEYDGAILYNAGGNSTYIFESEEIAKSFISKLSTFVIKNFPGLEIIMCKEKFDIEKTCYCDACKTLQRKIFEKKNCLKRYHDISFGMNKTCVYSGKPASYSIEMKDEGNIQNTNKSYIYLSQESLVKQGFYRLTRDSTNDKKSDIDKIYKRINEEKNDYLGYYHELKIDCIMKELNDIHGEKIPLNFVKAIKQNNEKNNEKNSYMALSCMDGNGMGEFINSKIKRIEELDISQLEKNIKYIKTRKVISEKIEKIYQDSFIETVNEFARKLDEDKKLIIRPLIFAGDDICIYSKADYSLGFMTKFAQKVFDKSSRESYEIDGENDSIDPLTLGIGVAIIKQKFPFYYAYKLANKLEDKAKESYNYKLIYTKNKKIKEYRGSYIDWELVRGEISSDRLKLKDHNNKDNNKTQRPYVIVDNCFYSESKTNKVDMGINEDESNEFLNNMTNTSMEFFFNVFDSLSGREGKSSIREYYKYANISEMDGEMFLKTHMVKLINSNNRISIDLRKQPGVLKDVIELQNILLFDDGGEQYGE